MNIFTLILLFIASLTTTNETTLDNNDDDKQSKDSLIMRSIDENPQLPKETQMAQCTVQSGDIKASAQATFSKKLEGFCSTGDMKMLKETLLDMESRLYRDIFNLQQLIERLLSPSNTRQYYSPSSSMYDNYYRDRINNHQMQTTLKTTLTTSTITPTTSTVINANKLKSLDTGINNNRKQSKEKMKDNENMATKEKIKPKNEYVYYWKLDQFPKIFQNARKNEIFSHVFNVKGLHLRIRAHMNYLENENLLLDIEHLANIENNEKMEIEISDGFVFKEIAEEKLFQYSFSILNQINPNHDLISPVFWNNENENFKIPNSVHLLSSYMKDNSILIKLTISF
ncbi:hypothetical protein PVAND_011594 [Polypedilum vanderplanki]|uniref:Uncharacterized protein n=1 Tax=Polypedilum vanderplanki TaxID=319348 RepID=A0A9J6CJT7_POLVA|nr:hypothetical protein PVAND_011594 [Polypedilum vanderplanki]